MHPSVPVIRFSPVIEYGEFPFRIVYEIDGVQYEIEDTILASFIGINSRGRNWSSSFKSGRSQRRYDIFSTTVVPYAFSRGRPIEEVTIWISFGEPDYYMGDRRGNRQGPRFMYTEMSIEGFILITSGEISKEQLYEYFDINVLEWSFSEPIRNRFRP
ncbi:MAG: hypothetical protein FWC95_07145 [Defluviitaleaceae bacterium]|nr:hypothetical protein [Defluviitaleaceae bacterium]